MLRFGSPAQTAFIIPVPIPGDNLVVYFGIRENSPSNFFIYGQTLAFRIHGGCSESGRGPAPGGKIVGIIAGVGVLFFNPDAGKKLGSFLYSSSKEPQSYAYAVARAAPGVVNIYVSTLNQNYSSEAKNPGTITNSASGVIMSSDGYIVTNYHVIPSSNEPNKAVWAQTRDGKVYQAFIVGYDRRTDIAVLKIDAQNLTPVPRDEDLQVNVGDVVLTIGNPNNLGQTVTHGIVSATARSGSGLLTRDQMNIREGLQDLIQTDAPINQGNSGGALVNTNGTLIGINTASFNNYRYGTYGIGFAVPTELTVLVMNEIIKHGRVIRGYLGISDDGTTSLPNSEYVGVRVGYIDPYGAAADSDIQIGDVIIKVDDKQITNLRSLIDIISGNTPGTTLKFTILRDGKTFEVPITLVEDRTGIE